MTPIGMRTSAGQAIAALSCLGVSKVFPVLDEGSSWRVLWRDPLQDRTIRALHEVTLSVPKGKMVGVLGRNGAGKSTLLRVLAGVSEPFAGTIERTGSLSGLFELGMGSNRFLTGREYARRSLLLQGVARAQLPDLLEDIREFAELDADFDRPLYTLSTGMAARLYFAAATAVSHDIYLLDEILAVGDEHFQGKCRSRLRERLAGGASGVLVTHDWTAILRLCEEAHIMEHGRIARSGPSEEIVQAYLNLSKDFETNVARFCPETPAGYVVRSQEDAKLPLSVDIYQSVPVVLAFSIEWLRSGAWWEILLLADDLPIGSRKGRYEVSLCIPRLPLAGGRYYLNLFLSSPTISGHRTHAGPYDARGWTYGNPVTLDVEGNGGAGVTRVPLAWSLEGARP